MILTITQDIDTEEDLTILATALGYTEKVQDGVKIEDVIDDDGKNVGTKEVINMVDNIGMKEWVENYFHTKNTTHGLSKILELEDKKDITKKAEKRKALEEILKKKLA